jgi:hypothetical protein
MFKEASALVKTMKKYNQFLIIFFLTTVLVVTSAFTDVAAAQEPVYVDDFEQYRSQSGLEKSWQVWQDGAQISVAIETERAGEGGQAMRVVVSGPNPQNNSEVGSFYHYLAAGNRNWEGATGFRFWVQNDSEEPLLLSLNFKKRFNEYWAVDNSGVFLLESPADHYQPREIAYGNLPIPGSYSGYVVVPFTSFAVPEWNTARGDAMMDLAGIESFAFGVTMQGDYPRTFILDAVSVITRAEYPYLEIKGVDSIPVPASGEHREPFSAYVTEPISGSSEMVDAEWALAESGGDGPVIGSDGWLSVPAGAAGETLILSALYTSEAGTLTDSHRVSLTGSPAGEGAHPEDGQATVPEFSPPAISEYERFSMAFENWATENRALFVLVSIGVVLLVLAVLSSFQKKIK